MAVAVRVLGGTDGGHGSDGAGHISAGDAGVADDSYAGGHSLSLGVGGGLDATLGPPVSIPSHATADVLVARYKPVTTPAITPTTPPYVPPVFGPVLCLRPDLVSCETESYIAFRESSYGIGLYNPTSVWVGGVENHAIGWFGLLYPLHARHGLVYGGGLDADTAAFYSLIEEQGLQPWGYY